MLEVFQGVLPKHQSKQTHQGFPKVQRVTTYSFPENANFSVLEAGIRDM